MKRHLFAVLAFLALPLPAAAQSNATQSAAAGHEHKEGEKGPNGGVVQDIAGYEVELVVSNGTVAVYVIDHASDKPVQTQGMQASVLFVQGTARKGTASLKPAGDKLEAKADVPAGADAVVSLRLPDGKSGQAKYELGGHSH